MKFQITILLLIALFALEANTLTCRSYRVHISRRACNPKCPNGWAMHGIKRGRNDDLTGITHFECCKLPNRVAHRYLANWVSSFDRAGWSQCPANYFMTGFQKSHGTSIIHLERGHCAKTTSVAGRCYIERSVVSTLDHANTWSKCKRGYLMTGMWRNHDNKNDRHRHNLHRIEHFRCCQPKTRVCKNHTSKQCRNKRVAYYTNVARRVRKTRRVRRVVNRRQKYLHKTCHTKNVRQYYSRAQKYRKRVSYNAVVVRRHRVSYRQRYTRVHNVRRRHYRNVRRTHRKTVRFSKRLPKYRRQTYWHYYHSTCTRVRRVRRRRRVATKQKYSCSKRAKVAKRVRYRKTVRVNSKRKVFTGRYVSNGAKDCYKKVYKWVPYVKVVRKWAYKVVLVWGTRRSTCIRTVYKYVHYFTNVTQRYRCRKRVKRTRTLTTYYTKWFTKVVKYTRVHRVAYYRNHRVTRTHYRTAYKYVNRRTVVRRYKHVFAWKNVRTSRVVPVVSTRSVWKYRTVPVVTYVNQGYYATVTQRVRRYKNTRVCVNVSRRVCRNV